MSVLWLLSDCSLIALWLWVLWPRKMKIDCSRQTCNGQTDTDSDSLRSCRSQKRTIWNSLRLRQFIKKLKLLKLCFPKLFESSGRLRMVIVCTPRLGCWRRNNTSVIVSWLIGASWPAILRTCSEIYHFCLSRCFLPRTGQCREINLSFKCNELETAQHNGLLNTNEVHIKKRFIPQHYLNDSLKLIMMLYCFLFSL